MPRTARRLVDDGTYHVMTRGNNGQVLFRHEYDYQRYLELLAGAARQHRVLVYHFALLPRHVHMVAHTAIGVSLTKMMRSLNLSYSWHYRKRYDYSGHLWQGRFQSRILEEEADPLRFGRSLEMKPVYAGLTRDPSAYPWSSYRAYADGVDGALITLNPRYERLGATAQERQARYRQLLARHEPSVPSRRSLAP